MSSNRTSMLTKAEKEFLELIKQDPEPEEIEEKFDRNYFRVMKHRIRKKEEQAEEELQLIKEAKKAEAWQALK